MIDFIAARRRRLAYTGIALAVLGLAACGSLEVLFGLRTRLDKLPVTALSATLSPQAALSPGSSGRLVITATTSDGKQYVTVGPGHGKVLFDSFALTASIVSVNSEGVVSLPADPRVSESQLPHVRITAIGHPGISADLDVPVHYDAAFQAHFSGADGMRGLDGSSGLDGMSGSDGSTDPNNPSAGGNGTDGGRGGDGSNGSPGDPGENVHVWVALRPGSAPLLQVRAASSSHQQFFLVDPRGGSLTVEANGGAGGPGGAGGRGGRGGSGGSGSPPGSPGQDGLDGSDGFAGSGGAAGTITMSIDPAAEGYADRIYFYSKTGDGAAGPAPIVQVESVPPPW
jgi:hypothetical protein